MGSVPNVSTSMELPSIEPVLQTMIESDHRQTVEDKNEDFVVNEESVNRYIKIIMY